MLGSWKAARPLGRLNSQRKAQRKIEENPQYLIIKRPHSAPGQANPEYWRLDEHGSLFEKPSSRSEAHAFHAADHASGIRA